MEGVTIIDFIFYEQCFYINGFFGNYIGKDSEFKWYLTFKASFEGMPFFKKNHYKIREKYLFHAFSSQEINDIIQNCWKGEPVPLIKPYKPASPIISWTQTELISNLPYVYIWLLISIKQYEDRIYHCSCTHSGFPWTLQCPVDTCQSVSLNQLTHNRLLHYWLYPQIGDRVRSRHRENSSGLLKGLWDRRSRHYRWY